MAGAIGGVVALSLAVHIAICLARRSGKQATPSSYSMPTPADGGGSGVPSSIAEAFTVVPETLTGNSEYQAAWRVQARNDLFNHSDDDA
jgi:hypothetical protein